MPEISKEQIQKIKQRPSAESAVPDPTPDNEKRLTALIAEYQSRHRLKEAIGEKDLHMKSPETLARASGQVAAAIHEQSQLKYAK